MKSSSANHPLDGVFLSVRPRFSKALLNGSKRVELRRKSFRVGRGTFIALYEASPTMAISGFLFVSATHVATPKALWSRFGQNALLSRAEYDDYFLGTERAFAIEVSNPIPLTVPISLSSLRKKCPGFMPPQSFRYLERLPVPLMNAIKKAFESATSST